MAFRQLFGDRKDAGSDKPVGFSGRVGWVWVAGQQFFRPEPAGTRDNTGTQYKIAVKNE